jgi:tyrosinase
MKSFFSQLTGLTATLSLLVTAQAALPSSSGPTCGALKYNDDSYLSVVGVQGTGVQPRQEIRDLEKDADMWNMYLLALSRFQAMDQREKISYYQIAGRLTFDPHLCASPNAFQVFMASHWVNGTV